MAVFFPRGYNFNVSSGVSRRPERPYSSSRKYLPSAATSIVPTGIQRRPGMDTTQEKLLSCEEKGRLMGFEPTTTGTTIQCSAIELQAPCTCCRTARTAPRNRSGNSRDRSSCPGYGWGTGIRTPIDGSKVRSPAIRRSPNNNLHRRPVPEERLVHRGGWVSECRGPDLNWGHQHFQCCALPTELLRQRGSLAGRPLESGR